MATVIYTHALPAPVAVVGPVSSTSSASSPASGAVAFGITDFGARNLIVTDGVVHLWGLVGSPDERNALVALAEGVPGVVRVSDELIPSYA